MALAEGLAGNIAISVIAVSVIIFSSEIAVKRIMALLNHFGYSTTFGGLVIFSVATSFPEIISHIVASIGILSKSLNYKIASATVLGANIGSDVIQQTLILGIVVFLMGSLTFKKSFLINAYLPMIGTTLLCIFLGWDRTFSRFDGFILLGVFVIYVAFLYKKETEEQSKKQNNPDINLKKDAITSILSLAAMLTSAYFLLNSIERIVFITGLGGSLIGVVSLGVAAASPELFIALAGLRNKAVGISIGTLIGSNITNPLVAIGLGSLLSTYWVPRPLLLWDLPMETATAALLLFYLLLTKRKLDKKGAVYLIMLYLAYLTIRIMLFSAD